MRYTENWLLRFSPVLEALARHRVLRCEQIVRYFGVNPASLIRHGLVNKFTVLLHPLIPITPIRRYPEDGPLDEYALEWRVCSRWSQVAMSTPVYMLEPQGRRPDRRLCKRSATSGAPDQSRYPQG